MIRNGTASSGALEHALFQPTASPVQSPGGHEHARMLRPYAERGNEGAEESHDPFEGGFPNQRLDISLQDILQRPGGNSWREFKAGMTAVRTMPDGILLS